MAFMSRVLGGGGTNSPSPGISPQAQCPQSCYQERGSRTPLLHLQTCSCPRFLCVLNGGLHNTATPGPPHASVAPHVLPGGPGHPQSPNTPRAGPNVGLRPFPQSVGWEAVPGRGRGGGTGLGAAWVQQEVGEQRVLAPGEGVSSSAGVGAGGVGSDSPRNAGQGAAFNVGAAGGRWGAAGGVRRG